MSQFEPRGIFTDAELRRQLQHQPLLSSLSMMSSERKSLKGVAEFPQVTTLSLKQAPPGLDTPDSWRRQLKGLSKLFALRHLHLHNVLYHGISPVSALTGLCSLSVHQKSPTISYRLDKLPEREVNSISVLHGLTHLQLQDCPDVKSIEALSKAEVSQVQWRL